MCLGIPGKIIKILNDDPVMRLGSVSFGGVIKEISLAYVPQAGIGDYVIVHAGFAISVLKEQEALEVFSYIQEIEAIETK
ncbi:MAG: HypC/HybG/HupF family hydrogenase formation chaperone [Deltaproteobacteria bacterium]|nr:HypC/HybG/HupF family hydrogenase formation chaperone [Deltaproteobacteria bacterium]